VYVSYLRRKLHVPQRPDLIETVRGTGYRLMVDDV
jgi:DNA-binding response OmpR family regulator